MSKKYNIKDKVLEKVEDDLISLEHTCTNRFFGNRRTGLCLPCFIEYCNTELNE